MHPAQVLRRPLTARVMKGAAGRYTQYPNRLHARGMILLKDHIVRSVCSIVRTNLVLIESFRAFVVLLQSYGRGRRS